MARTLLKSRLHSNEHKPKIEQEINNTKSTLPPNLQSIKQKFLNFCRETSLLNIITDSSPFFKIISYGYIPIFCFIVYK